MPYINNVCTLSSVHFECEDLLHFPQTTKGDLITVTIMSMVRCDSIFLSVKCIIISTPIYKVDKI